VIAATCALVLTACQPSSSTSHTHSHSHSRHH
jgi:hypothetical protein